VSHQHPAICTSFEKCLLSSYAHLLIWFLIDNSFSVLYTLWILILWKIVRILCHLFILFIVLFAVHKLFNLMQSYLSILLSTKQLKSWSRNLCISILKITQSFCHLGKGVVESTRININKACGNTHSHH
jgi:hypothetical protein